MIRNLICIAICFIALPVMAQNYKSGFSTDTATSQELVEKSAPELIKEANSNAKGSPVKSIQQATAALDKSIKSGDKRSQYQSYNTLGSLYFNVGNFAAAAQYFTLASAGFEELNDPKNKAFSDKYLAASKSKLIEIKVSKTIKSTDASKSKKSKNGGSVNTSNSAPSLLYTEIPSNKTEVEKIDILTELGSQYLVNKDTLQAVNAWNQAAGFTLAAPNKVVLSNATTLATAYNSTNRYQENIEFQNKVLDEGKKRGATDIMGIASHNLGTTYVEAAQPNLAVPFLIQSIALASSDNNINQKQKSVKELARAYEKMGRYDKALFVIKDYIRTLDSLQGLQDKNLEANATLNDEFMKQEERIQKLIVNQKKKEADFKRQQLITWSLAGVLALFGLLTYLLVRNIRQKQKANMQIKLQSLRTQMNPHFIFNSLNSVNNFISKNDERSANRYLTDFSKLMRTVLKNSDQDFVTLDTEIQTLKIYLELEHFRFGEKFDYNLEVADDIDPNHVQVPPMLIQPYIENAIWHGLRYKDGKGLLEVKFFTEDGKLYCTVKDNGIGRDKSAALKTDHQKTYQSTGIQNTRDRIDLLNKLHGTKLQISIFDLNENGKACGTMARISIPHIMQFEEI